MDATHRDAVPGPPESPDPGAGAQASPSPAPPRAPRAVPRCGGPGLGAWFAHSRDLGALERMLLAWSVHPAGAGFDRARLLVWSPSRQLLAGRLWWGASGGPGDPGEALLQAQRLMSDGPHPERTLEVRGLAVRPDQLAGVASAAWHASSVAVGAESRAGDLVLGPAAAFGAVRFTRAGRALALLLGDWDTPGEEAAREAALVQLRDLASAALDAQATRDESERRRRHAAALAEFARACVSPLNLAEILDLAARMAVEATDSRGGALWVADAGGAPELRATHGPLGARERLGRALAALAAAAIERSRPLVLDPVAGDPRLTPDVAAQIRNLVVLPLAAYGRASGALAVYDHAVSHPAESGTFDRADLEFLSILADLVALAEDQAGRFDALRQGERRQRELQREVARSERLASLGEMAARVAHEVRNPLASIGAFARRAHRNLGPDDPNREYLEIVIREAERLERMVGEQLQYATLQRPRLKLESVNGILQEALQAAGERLVRRRVRLLKKLTPDLPPLLLDAERIRRVVGNILDNAVESVSPGGRVRVESRRSGSYVVVDVANDGPRRPGDAMEQLFVPFALSRQGGPGVGLAVAQQVLKQHGGEMRLRSEGEWSAIFSFTLPIPENQDRRLHEPDRRHARADRRDRYPSV